MPEDFGPGFDDHVGAVFDIQVGKPNLGPIQSCHAR